GAAATAVAGAAGVPAAPAPFPGLAARAPLVTNTPAAAAVIPSISTTHPIRPRRRDRSDTIIISFTAPLPHPEAATTISNDRQNSRMMPTPPQHRQQPRRSHPPPKRHTPTSDARIFGFLV